VIAAENGKHVVVEKPMALSLEGAEAMNTAAERYGTKLLCGHTHSFDPPIRKMREIVRSGKLGKLCMVHTWNYNEFILRVNPDYDLRVSRGLINTELENAEEYAVNWHVPVDDTHYWEYAISFNRKKTLDKEQLRKERMDEFTPEHKSIRNKSNRYL
jgi:Oxidoreductase family, NAD-binding Rossmann fold